MVPWRCSSPKRTPDNAPLFAGTTSWTDYTVQARIKPLSLATGGFVRTAGPVHRLNHVLPLALLPGNQVQLQAVRSGAVTVIGTSSRTVATGTWYTVALEVSGSTIRGYVGGTLVASGTSTAITTAGSGSRTSLATANFDDVTVTTGGTVPTTPPNTTTTASADHDPARHDAARHDAARHDAARHAAQQPAAGRLDHRGQGRQRATTRPCRQR